MKIDMTEMFNPPHPGEVLKEEFLEPLGLTITETAKALGVSRKAISEIVNQRAGISADMALRLAYAFDTTPDLWMGMMESYALFKAKKVWKDLKKSNNPIVIRPLYNANRSKGDARL